MTNEEAIKHVENMKKGVFLFHPDELYDTIINALKDEPKTGHWIAYQNKQVCSECGNAKPLGVATYCRGCGAKMQ